jgi:hypothetical protein
MNVVCIATGPSLTQEDVTYAHERADLTVTVNDAWQLVPMQGKDCINYAADPDWWRYHHKRVFENWQGECHTQEKNWGSGEAEALGLHIWNIDTAADGLSENKDLIHGGGNSGYQAIGIAKNLGAKKIILLGYDMSNAKGLHFFGPHPPRLDRKSDPSRFIRRFETIKDNNIINCTRHTALTCFNRMGIKDAI